MRICSLLLFVYIDSTTPFSMSAPQNRGGRGQGRGGRGDGAKRTYRDPNNRPPPNTTPNNRPPPNTTPNTKNHYNPNPSANPAKKLNGEKGASASTIAEDYKIKFTSMLLNFREDPDQSELVLPSDLTNTERKFIHTAARGLGLVSKSRGKEGSAEGRKIHVNKGSTAVRRAGVGSAQHNGSGNGNGNDDEDVNPDTQLPTLAFSSNVKKLLATYVVSNPPSEDEMMESYSTGSSTIGSKVDVSTMLKNLNLSRDAKKRKMPKVR